MSQMHCNFSKESAQLRALRAKNVLTCQRALRALVLTYQRALGAHVLKFQHALSSIPQMAYAPRDQLPSCLACLVSILMSLLAVSLPLLLKLYTLLVRFDNLIFFLSNVNLL